jgi:hypothetical protein
MSLNSAFAAASSGSPFVSMANWSSPVLVRYAFAGGFIETPLATGTATGVQYLEKIWPSALTNWRVGPQGTKSASVNGFRPSICAYRWLQTIVFVVNENVERGQWIRGLVMTAHYRWLGVKRRKIGSAGGGG